MKCPNCGCDISAADLEDTISQADYENADWGGDAAGEPDVSEYTEWQDLYGGDDWDHGQYDEVY